MARKKASQPALLYSRRDVEQLLGCSVALIRSLEAQGRLKPITLGTGLSRRGLRYRKEEVHALIKGEKSALENRSI